VTAVGQMSVYGEIHNEDLNICRKLHSFGFKICRCVYKPRGFKAMFIKMY